MKHNQSTDDEYFMQLALNAAAKAEALGEIPVGAVLVADGQVIAEGYNRCITDQDPSAHAEMVAIRSAGQKLSNYRLPNTTLYVTLEPCSMCAGLLVHARISRLVYGASDAKTGCAGSLMNLVNDARLNHQIELGANVLAQECSQYLSAWFKRRRLAQKALKEQHD